LPLKTKKRGCFKSRLLLKQPFEFKIKSLYCNDLILNIALKIKVTALKLKFSDSLGLFFSRTRVHCVLSEVFGAAFKTFAFCAFRNVFYFSAFTQSFHNNFTAAGTKKLVSCDCGTRVFTGACHKLPPDIKVH